MLIVFLFCYRILSSGTNFIIDETFKAAPKFGGECTQLFVIMGIAMDVVSLFG